MTSTLRHINLESGNHRSVYFQYILWRALGTFRVTVSIKFNDYLFPIESNMASVLLYWKDGISTVIRVWYDHAPRDVTVWNAGSLPAVRGVVDRLKLSTDVCMSKFQCASSAVGRTMTVGQRICMGRTTMRRPRGHADTPSSALRRSLQYIPSIQLYANIDVHFVTRSLTPIH